MEPGFSRGDLLFLHNHDMPYEVGDIVVYKMPARDIPIVHRVHEVHIDKRTNSTKLLTKGDANFAHDRTFYDGEWMITPDHVQGRVWGFLPYVGVVTVLMNDFPLLKFALIGSIGLFVMLNRENS